MNLKKSLKVLQDAAKEVNPSLRVSKMHDGWPKGRNAELDVRIDLGASTGCRIVWIKKGILQQEKMGPNTLGYDYFYLSSQDDIDKWKKTLNRLIRINELVQRTRAVNTKKLPQMPIWLKKKAKKKKRV